MTGVGLAHLPGMGIVALDFDNVIGPDGSLPPEVEAAISGTYAEISPSGSGVRAFLRGDLGNHKSAQSAEYAYGFEVFSTTGFVTFTGDLLPAARSAGLEDVVAPAGEAVRALCKVRFRAANSNAAPGRQDSDDFMLGREPRLILSDEEIRDYLSDLDPSRGRDEWIRVGMALHHQTGGEGFDLWDVWSSEGHQYPGTDALRVQWRSFKAEAPGRPQVTFRTVLGMSRDARAAKGLPARGTAGPEIAPAAFSEDYLADAFSRKLGEDWRFVSAWGQWYQWTGRVWRRDDTRAVFDQIRGICREAARRASEIKSRLSKASTTSAVEWLARGDRRHAAAPDTWDNDPWLLNTPRGIVSLRDGRLGPHYRGAYMTKSAAASPQGDCPTWRQFLDTITGGDASLQAYLQRVAGYCLTGDIREHALFFAHGTGANGKSVFVNTLTEILGDYAQTAGMDMFMDSRNDRHPTELADLRGARLIVANETEQGRRWAESRIKSLTGGDRIRARFMRQDFFEYSPQFKLMVVGNHRPSIRNLDEAMRRRLQLIPFAVTIPKEKRDQRLPQRLLDERDGILAWALEGCLLWQAEGLSPPDCVRAATDEYFEAEDAVARWLEDNCELGDKLESSSADLFADWSRWCSANGESEGTQKRLTETLKGRGFAPTRTRLARGFRGVGVRQEPTAADASEFD
jgi:P4 family phage/plasmid primase-like protien